MVSLFVLLWMSWVGFYWCCLLVFNFGMLMVLVGWVLICVGVWVFSLYMLCILFWLCLYWLIAVGCFVVVWCLIGCFMCLVWCCLCLLFDCLVWVEFVWVGAVLVCFPLYGF